MVIPAEDSLRQLELHLLLPRILVGMTAGISPWISTQKFYYISFPSIQKQFISKHWKKSSLQSEFPGILPSFSLPSNRELFFMGSNNPEITWIHGGRPQALMEKWRLEDLTRSDLKMVADGFRCVVADRVWQIVWITKLSQWKLVQGVTKDAKNRKIVENHLNKPESFVMIKIIH